MDYDALLSRILHQLYFISFFPDRELHEEILGILYYFEIIFRLYPTEKNTQKWKQISRVIRINSRQDWLSIRTFEFLKFKWKQWKITRQLRSLPKLNLKLSKVQIDLLQKTYDDLTEIRRILHKTRPIVYNLIRNKFSF
jgi:hypothetical protein